MSEIRCSNCGSTQVSTRIDKAYFPYGLGPKKGRVELAYDCTHIHCFDCKGDYFGADAEPARAAAVKQYLKGRKMKSSHKALLTVGFVLFCIIVGVGIWLENKHKHNLDTHSSQYAVYEQVEKHAYKAIAGGKATPTLADKQLFVNYLGQKGITVSDAQAIIIKPHKVDKSFQFDVWLSSYQYETDAGTDDIKGQLVGTFDRPVIEGYFHGRGNGAALKDEDLK